MGRFIALVSLLLLLGWAPARAEWLRAESPSFIVYSEGNQEELQNRVLQLEEFDRLLRLLTGANAPPSPNKLQVYLVSGVGRLNRILPMGRFSGVYSASADGIFAVVDTAWREDWTTHEEVLLHEYAHHFMMQYFPAAYPAWYVEGFAEYVGPTRFTDDTIELGRSNPARASWLADRSGWLPLDRLLFSDPGELRGREVAKFYAQSWLLVHYLLRDPERQRRLATYLNQLARGIEPRVAFGQALGTTASALQRSLSVYGGDDMTYSRLPRISRGQTPPVRITRLAGVSDDLVHAQAALQFTQRENTESLLQRVRSLTGDRADPLARRLLARAEALYGDGAVADALLDPLLAEAPGDAELLYLKGMRFLVAGRRDEANRADFFRQAQIWFVRAHRADGNHYPTLYRYAESLSLEPNFLSENTANVLLLANQLAPQVAEIAWSAGNLLLRRGEFARAEALLAPIAADPHGGGFAEAARAMRDKARARDNAGLPGVFEHPSDED